MYRLHWRKCLKMNVQWNITIKITMGLNKSDLNGEVTVFPELKVQFFARWKLILGLRKGDHIAEVTLLVR